jgi:hypothetical protein
LGRRHWTQGESNVKAILARFTWVFAWLVIGGGAVTNWMRW